MRFLWLGVRYSLEESPWDSPRGYPTVARRIARHNPWGLVPLLSRNLLAEFRHRISRESLLDHDILPIESLDNFIPRFPIMSARFQYRVHHHADGAIVSVEELTSVLHNFRESGQKFSPTTIEVPDGFLNNRHEICSDHLCRFSEERTQGIH